MPSIRAAPWGERANAAWSTPAVLDVVDEARRRRSGGGGPRPAGRSGRPSGRRARRRQRSTGAASSRPGGRGWPRAAAGSRGCACRSRPGSISRRRPARRLLERSRRRAAARPRAPRTGTSATPPSTTRGSPSSGSATATATSAKSPWRRANSCIAARLQRRREAHGGDDLVRLERGREVAEQELLGGDLALALRPGDLDHRAERDRDQAPLGGGVRVGEAAAERAAAADRLVTDPLRPRRA